MSAKAEGNTVVRVFEIFRPRAAIIRGCRVVYSSEWGEKRERKIDANSYHKYIPIFERIKRILNYIYRYSSRS